MDSSKEQFSLIYDQYIEKIYRFVYLKVNSQEIAEDITSKVFLNGWKSYQKDPQKIQNEKAFLYQIARNMVTDYYRYKGKENVISTDYVSQIADDRTGLHEKAIINSDMDIVRTAISQLRQEHQDVLIWHYLEDMPVTEISQILNKPEGTVRVMMHRGLNALRDVLNQEA